MIYTFTGGNQIAKVKTDESRNVYIASQMTGFKLVPISILIKKEKMEEFKLRTKDMTDEQFEQYVIREFATMGYSLESKQ